MDGTLTAIVPSRHVDDDTLSELFRNTRSIAMVGASPRPTRPSHGVMRALQARAYRVFPVNPLAAGEHILGEPVHSRLADVPEPVQIVDVFRHSNAAGAVVDEAIADMDRLDIRAVWMQIGVRDEHAAARGRAAGLLMVMDLCLKIEVARLLR
jgi:predicted CoA-binding protein